MALRPESMPLSCRAAARRLGLASCALALVLAGALVASAQGPVPELTRADGKALIAAVRQTAGADSPALNAKADARLIVSAYRRGNRLGQVFAKGDTLAAAAKESAALLAKALGRESGNPLSVSLVSVDVITATRAVKLDPKEPIGAKLDIGAEGLAVSVNQNVRYFTPLTVLYHSGAPEFLASLYGETGETAPVLTEPNVRTEAFATRAFVELSPAGEVTDLGFGNLAVTAVNMDALGRAYLKGTMALLAMQEEDGRFVEGYDPIGAKRRGSGDPLAEMQAAQTLLWVYLAVGDRDLKDAADKAIVAMRKHLELASGAQPLSYVKVGASDEFTASLALLQALCVRASVLGKVEDPQLMEHLGRFIAEMIRDDGAVYLWFRSRAANEAPPEDTHGAASEAVLTLCDLYEVMPAPKNPLWLLKAERVLRRESARIAIKDVPDPRLVEASARLYLIKNDQQYADQCLQLAARLRARINQPAATAPPELVGGFASPGGPFTRPTAMCLKALVAAHEVAQLTGRAEQSDPATIMLAVRFVMSQQYRAENSFYLQKADALQGSYRAGARDLLARLDATRAAVDALISAVNVVAEHGDR